MTFSHLHFLLCIENDKENDSRSVQATQAVIQRRRRPKRRSTGVVHVDMDVRDMSNISLKLLNWQFPLFFFHPSGN